MKVILLAAAAADYNLIPSQANLVVHDDDRRRLLLLTPSIQPVACGVPAIAQQDCHSDYQAQEGGRE